jgi:hypothetical protein
MSDDAGIEILDDDGKRRFFDRDDYMFYAGLQSRLGFNALMALVEYGHFHPKMGPRPNEEFLFSVMNFHGVLHFIFGVPKRYRQKVNELAAILKLRPVMGVPMVIDGTGVRTFPATDVIERRKNFYVVEGGDTQVYNNDPLLAEQIRERERTIIDALLQHGSKLSPKAVSEYLWRRQ